MAKKAVGKLGKKSNHLRSAKSRENSDPTEWVMDVPFGPKGQCVGILVWVQDKDPILKALERSRGREAIIKHLLALDIWDLLAPGELLRDALVRRPDVRILGAALRHGRDVEYITLLLVNAIVHALVVSQQQADITARCTDVLNLRMKLRDTIRKREMSKERAKTAETYLALLAARGKQVSALEALVRIPGEENKTYAKCYREGGDYERLRNYIRAVIRDYQIYQGRRGTR
jgi:hypothetical protein